MFSLAIKQDDVTRKSCLSKYTLQKPSDYKKLYSREAYIITGELACVLGIV